MRIFVWRGRIPGMVELPERDILAQECVPWCGVCQRPVDRSTCMAVGEVARLAVFCHGRMEMVEVPLGAFRHGDRLELGIAFSSSHQPWSVEHRWS
jgi:hypothetical protein